MWQELRDKVQVSKDHNSTKNGRNKNEKPHAHLHTIRSRSTKFQINPMKDVGGVAGTRFRTDRRKDERMHTRTDKCHFYSPLRLGRVTKTGSPLSSSRYLTSKTFFFFFFFFFLLLLLFSYSNRRYNGVLWKTHFMEHPS